MEKPILINRLFLLLATAKLRGGVRVWDKVGNVARGVAGHIHDLDALSLPIKVVTARQGHIGAGYVFTGGPVNHSLSGLPQQVHAPGVVRMVVGD